MPSNNATQNFDPLLFRVAEKTFGELAFLLVEPDEFTRDRQPTWSYIARLEFIGPFGGEMQLGITENLLRPLAANMLGIDEHETLPDGVVQEDALRELLNVTCGNFLPLVSGNEAVFHIGDPGLIPRFIRPPSDKYVSTGQILLHLEVGSACLTFYVDPDADLTPPANSDIGATQ